MGLGKRTARVRSLRIYRARVTRFIVARTPRRGGGGSPTRVRCGPAPGQVGLGERACEGWLRSGLGLRGLGAWLGWLAGRAVDGPQREGEKRERKRRENGPGKMAHGLESYSFSFLLSCFLISKMQN